MQYLFWIQCLKFIWWSGPLLCMACTSQPCFYFNFKTEELVHSVLCAMWHLGHNSTRIKILPWKIDRLSLHLWLPEITKVRIRFQSYLFKAGKIISCIQNLIVPIVPSWCFYDANHLVTTTYLFPLGKMLLLVAQKDPQE